jgi:hypothetical protein
VLIPAWQQPDEHAQVAIVEAYRERWIGVRTEDPGREGAILQSLADHDWWRHYSGEPAPAPAPQRFARIGGDQSVGGARNTLGANPTSTDYPPLYYGTISGALAILPRLTVLEELWVMRGLSAVLGIVTLWVVWMGAREAAGEIGGVTIAAALALHPQFAVVSTTASPDGLINLAGAVLWWQAMRALRPSARWWPLAGVWIAAIAGTAADRMGLPLLIAAAVITAALVLRGLRGWRAAVLAAGGAAMLAVSLWLANHLWRTFDSAVWQQLLPISSARTWEFATSFVMYLYRSWWFTLGWMRYPPPGWWLALTMVLTGVAAAGMLRVALDSRDGGGTRLRIALAGAVAGVQLAAIYWVYFRLAVAPQGRHLFPVMAPMLLLMWMGSQAAVPRAYRGRAALALVLLFAMLDLSAWALVGMPSYTW